MFIRLLSVCTIRIGESSGDSLGFNFEGPIKYVSLNN